jgi:hypothetical protein
MTTPTLICGAAVLGPVRFWELWDVAAYRNRSHLKRAVKQQLHTKDDTLNLVHSEGSAAKQSCCAR